MNKQNIYRDIEIKKKLTVTKGGSRGGFSGTCTKDTWTKPKGSRIEGGRW